jgi:hypothetical protein
VKRTPGLSLAGLTYGALQVAGFGSWARPRRIRISGLTAGVICEVALAVALLIRLQGVNRGYSASWPRSPVRMRMTSSTGVMKILPSPTWPVRATPISVSRT